MAVYVDPLKHIVAKGKHARRVGARHGHQWCHMWADTTKELHTMAYDIGLKREWYQHHLWLPHYDLIPRTRKRAVDRGAIETTAREMVKEINRRRNEPRT